MATAMGDELKTPEEWAKEKGFRIMDPDGWRMAGAPAWDEPIPYAEFLQRMACSTIMHVGNDDPYGR